MYSSLFGDKPTDLKTHKKVLDRGCPKQGPGRDQKLPTWSSHARHDGANFRHRTWDTEGPHRALPCEWHLDKACEVRIAPNAACFKSLLGTVQSMPCSAPATDSWLAMRCHLSSHRAIFSRLETWIPVLELSLITKSPRLQTDMSGA